MKWLDNVVNEIKSTDASKPVILEMDFKAGMEDQIQYIHDHLSIDSFGLRVKDTTGLESLFQYGKELGISFFVSNLNTNVFLENPEKFIDHNLVLSNFQDEHYSNWVTFDGIVDVYGHPRVLYSEVKKALTGKPAKIEEVNPKILRP